MGFDTISYVMGMNAAKGSGSSGGGTGGASFPEGVYFENDGMGVPTKYYRYIYEKNGTLYSVARTSDGNSPTYSAKLYKYADGAWTALVTASEFRWSCFTNYNCFQCVINGKTHFLGGSNHGVIDEENGTLTNLNYAPASLNYFIDNNRLFGESSGKFYSWDESTDTWTQEGTSSFSTRRCFTINNKGYCTYRSSGIVKLYEFDNMSWKDTGVVLVGDAVRPFVVGSKLYYIYSSSNNQYMLACFDADTMTDRALGTVPYFGGAYCVFVYFNNKLRYCAPSYDDTINAVLHIISKE